MSKAVWVFKTFGLMAGIQYVWDSFKLWAKRFNFKSVNHKRFSELSDYEASRVAFGAGIYKWESREHLNQIMNNLHKTLH